MKKSQYYQYFVEGENEEKIVNVLKTELRLITAGKVQKFNIVEQKMTNLRLTSLKKGTTVVLVFDTDTGNAATLIENIRFLEKNSNVTEVLCITQVRNLEDELIRRCDIKQIKELTGSKSNRDFKHDMLKDNAFAKKLERHHFDIHSFWSMNDPGEYSIVPNMADKIKVKEKKKA